MGTLGHRIAAAARATIEACAGLAFTVGVIVVALGLGGRW